MPSAGGSHHCQHVESSGGKNEGGTMVLQQPSLPGSHEKSVVSWANAGLICTAQSGIIAMAAPIGGSGKADSCSQQRSLAEHPGTK